MVKDCDPSTGLPDCEEGYDDEYMVMSYMNVVVSIIYVQYIQGG